MAQEGFIFDNVDLNNVNKDNEVIAYEVYIEEIPSSKNKKYKCTDCKKSFKTEQGVRHHRDSVHNKKQSRKHDDSIEESSKRPLLMSPVPKTTNYSDMAEFCKEVMGNPGDEPLAEMSIMNPKDVAAMNSTFIGEDDSTIPPDQDHRKC